MARVLKYTYFVGSIFLLFCAFLLQQKITKPMIQVSKQDSAITLNGRYLRILDVGQHRLLSSWLWITTIIDSDLDHYKQKDLNSWLYLRFKMISDLDPYFLTNYIFGGEYLSIVKDDDIGAYDFLKLGLTKFPDNFHLNYQMGYHLYYELGKKEESLHFYEKTLKSPNIFTSHKFLPAYVLKLKANLDSPEDALTLLWPILEKTPTGTPYYERLLNRVNEIKKQIENKEKKIK